MSKTASNPENIKVWSVNEILANYSTLGIPHFQRGMVWNDSNIALLLESLYFGTPCGNIILWEPPVDRETKDYGEPLPGAEQASKYLVIDGQQRIRTLHGIKTEIDTGAKKSGDDIPYVWAVNLGEFSKLQEFSQTTEGIAFKQGKPDSLFVKVKDPVLQKRSYIDYARKKIEDGSAKTLSPEYRNQYNFIPINIIMKDAFPDDLHITFNNGMERKCFSEFKKDPRKKADCLMQITEKLIPDHTVFVDLEEENRDAVMKFLNALHDHLMRIFERKFPVRILDTDDMSDIIHTYIRINSGGRAVQQEEKTIARLVQLCPEYASDADGGSFSAIAKLFEKIHGQTDPGNVNDHYQRLKETLFGFKLFVRVFVLAASYHTGRAIGSQTMSFSAIESNDELETCAGRDSIPKIWAVVEKVTLAVKDLLENELCFDSLAFLPDSRSLWPMFMILIKHPQFIDGNRIHDDWRNHFAYILLTLLLGTGDSETTIVGLMKDIREFADDGQTLLDNMIKNGNLSGKDTDRWKNIMAATASAVLKPKLANANALNNRYTLLLYALERHLNAVDFYGASLPEDIRDDFPADNQIREALNPEKQHIVPYSALNAEDQDSELNKGRKSNDKSNNIGNITYISKKLNSYETGLGSQWLDLGKAESALNTSHVISDEAVGYYNEMFEMFGKICDGKDATKLSIGDKAYMAWIDRRQKDIAEAFYKWRIDLKSKAENPPVGGFIPHAQILVPPQGNIDENEAGDGNPEVAVRKKVIFKWLAYLSEIWNVPQLSIEEKRELADKFCEPKRALVKNPDGTYDVFVGKKKILSYGRKYAQCDNARNPPKDIESSPGK